MLLFVAITFACLNWAIQVDMLLYIIVPHRRNAATSWQITISHLFGDASGPYIVGQVSEALRNNDKSPAAYFHSLQTAFYVPTALLVLSAIAFGVATWTVLQDKQRFEDDMGN